MSERPSKSIIRGDDQHDKRRRELAVTLRTRFTQSERELLLRVLDVNPEDVKLKPETREDFAWAMVEYFDHRARLADLWGAVQLRRPLQSGDRAAAPRRPPLLGYLLGAIATLTAALSLAPHPPGGETREAAPKPFKEPMGGIVLSIPAVSSPDAIRAHRALCEELQAHGAARVRCLPLRGAGPPREETVDMAKRLRASLAVTIEEPTEVHITALGTLEGDRLLGTDTDVSQIDISPAGSPRALAPVLRVLADIAAPGLQSNDVPCIPVAARGDQKPADSITLLAIYTRLFSPRCAVTLGERDLLLSAARCDMPDVRRSCALAKYLLAERCQACNEVQRNLEELEQQFPGTVYREIAMLKLARLACDHDDDGRKRARKVILELQPKSERDPCLHAELSPLAACVLSNKAMPKSPEDDILRPLADLPLADYEKCRRGALAATALAGRAFRYAKAGDWARAAEAYKQAQRRFQLPEYLLSHAESMLQQNSEEATKGAIDLLNTPDAQELPSGSPAAADAAPTGRHQLYGPVLLWVAARRRVEKADRAGDPGEALSRQYDLLRVGEDSALENDPDLENLLRAAAGDGCLYGILREKRNPTSGGRLKACLARISARPSSHGHPLRR